MYSIYALIDPRDNKPFYVGITDNIYKRFWQHVNCKGTNYERNKRIQELRSLDLMVIMQTLEQIEGIGHARIREAYWIRHFEALGHVLTNIVRPIRELKAKILVRSPRVMRKLGEAGGEETQALSECGFKRRLTEGQVPDDKHEDLAYFYKKHGDVKKALREIGVGNHCYRHAAWLLEQRGLKTIRRA